MPSGCPASLKTRVCFGPSETRSEIATGHMSMNGNSSGTSNRPFAFTSMLSGFRPFQCYCFSTVLIDHLITIFTMCGWHKNLQRHTMPNDLSQHLPEKKSILNDILALGFDLDM